MTSRTDLDRLLDLAHGRLPDAERDALDARLAVDPELAATWRDLTLVLEAGEEPVPPCDLPFERLALPRPRPRLVRWAPWAAAASLFAVLGVQLLQGDLGAGTAGPGPARGGPAADRRPRADGGPVALVAVSAAALAEATPARGAAPADDLLPGGLPVDAVSYRSGGAEGVRFLDGVGGAQALARASGRPVVVFVHETTCPLCRQLEATTFRDPALGAAAEPVVLTKVLASRGGAELLKTHPVGWPVFVVYAADGSEVKALGGTPSAAELAAVFAEAAARAPAGRVPAPWATVRDVGYALAAADAARDEGERADALREAAAAAAGTPLADVVLAGARALSGGVAAVLREARARTDAGRVAEALAALDRALVVHAGDPYAPDLEAVRRRLAADGVFPPLEGAR